MFDGFKVLEHEQVPPDEFEEVDATDLMKDKLKVMNEDEMIKFVANLLVDRSTFKPRVNRRRLFKTMVKTGIPAVLRPYFYMGVTGGLSLKESK